MHFDYFVKILPVLATIIAALIAAALSFVSLTLSKEQKTSEFRQKWIDGLREDLSVFLSSARAFARAVESERMGADSSFSGQKIADFRHKATETFYKIKLRLNPQEIAHEQLLMLLSEINEKQNRFLNEGEASPQPVLSAIDVAADHSIYVLKAEWRRVKEGELPFRIVRNWVAPLIVILSLGFVFVIFFVRPNG
jgi:hypothetical protein